MTSPSSRGKGALPTPPYLLARHWRFAGPETPPVVDWSAPYRVEQGFTVEQTDQGPSLRCTSDATCYYGEALNRLRNRVGEQYSRRYIYSQVYEPQGGAYIWRAMAVPARAGFASMASVPDPVPLSEMGMRSTTENPHAVVEAMPEAYALIQHGDSIDRLADIVLRYGGFVTGFGGRDDMFYTDGTTRPFDEPVQWGHAVWCCGFLIHNDQKMLLFKNSWGNDWGTNGYGYIPEEFVSTGGLFESYVYASIRDIIQPMKRLIRTTASQDQFLIEGTRRFKIPDLATLAYLRDELKVVGELEVVSEAEMAQLTVGRPIPSIEVDRKLKELLPVLIDAYQDNQ